MHRICVLALATGLALPNSSCSRSEAPPAVPTSTAVSDDRRFSAHLSGTRVTIRSSDGSARELDLPLEKKTPYFLYFTSDGTLRIYPQQRFERATADEPQVDDIHTIRMESRSLPSRCTVSSPFPGLFLRPSHDGARLLALEKQRSIVTLYSGDGCSRIAGLHSTGKLRAAAFTSEGGVAVILARESGCVVVRYDAGGESLSTKAVLGKGSDAFVQISRDGDRLFVGVSDAIRTSPAWRSSWHFAVIDQRGVLPIESFRDCVPAKAFDFWSAARLPAPTNQVDFDCRGEARSVDMTRL